MHFKLSFLHLTENLHYKSQTVLPTYLRYSFLPTLFSLLYTVQKVLLHASETSLHTSLGPITHIRVLLSHLHITSLLDSQNSHHTPQNFLSTQLNELNFSIHLRVPSSHLSKPYLLTSVCTSTLPRALLHNSQHLPTQLIQPSLHSSQDHPYKPECPSYTTHLKSSLHLRDLHKVWGQAIPFVTLISEAPME